MTFTFNVCDNETGKVLSGASIAVNGSIVGQTDSGGNYTVTLGNSGEDSITVSCAGYSNYTIPSGLLEESAQVQLSLINSSVPAQVVPAQLTETHNLLPWFIFGGGAALLFLGSNRVSGIGAVSKKQTGLIVAVAGAAALGVYLLSKKSVPAAAMPGAIPAPARAALPPSSTSFLTSGESLFSSITKLFSPSAGPTTPNTPGAFVPETVQPIGPSAGAGPAIQPSATFADLNPQAPAIQYTEPPAPSDGLSLDQTSTDTSIDTSGDQAMAGVLDYPLIAPAVIVGAILLMTGKKKIGSVDYTPFLLIGALGLGGYFLYNKLFGSGSAQGQNTATQTQTLATGTSSTLSTLQSQGQGPILSASQAASLANDIFTQGSQVSAGLNFWQSNTSYLQQIFNDFAKCQNDADLYLIVQNFGVRKAADSSWSMCALFGANCSSFGLEEFITTVLNGAGASGFGVTDLNTQLLSQGLTYQF